MPKGKGPASGIPTGLKSRVGTFDGRRPIVRFTELASNKGLLIAIAAIIATAAGAGVYVASYSGGPGGSTSSASRSSSTSSSTFVGPPLLTLSGRISATG
jgi:hypothetical protein